MDGRNKSGHDDKGPRFSAGLFVFMVIVVFRSVMPALGAGIHV